MAIHPFDGFSKSGGQRSGLENLHRLFAGVGLACCSRDGGERGPNYRGRALLLHKRVQGFSLEAFTPALAPQIIALSIAVVIVRLFMNTSPGPQFLAG